MAIAAQLAQWKIACENNAFVQLLASAIYRRFYHDYMDLARSFIIQNKDQFDVRPLIFILRKKHHRQKQPALNLLSENYSGRISNSPRARAPS